LTAGDLPAWAVVLASASGVFALALAGDAYAAPAPLAVAMAVVALALPRRFALGLLLVLAASPELLRGSTVGRLSVVDVVIVALVVRNATSRSFWRAGAPSVTSWLGIAAVTLAGLATAMGPPSGVTPFLRVAAYLVLGLTCARALTPRDVPVVLATVLGWAIGQVAAAVLSITGTDPTGLGIGRYLGTLGDPAQFGIPVAVALLLLAFSPQLLPSALWRWLTMVALLVGLVGSNTRGAWGAAVVAATIMLASRLREGRRPGLAFFVGFTAGVAIVALSAAVTIGAPLLGLHAGSTSVRIDSITNAWEYLTHHPFSTLGLGSSPGGLPVFNTWLALGVDLTLLTSVAFAGYVVSATVAARRISEGALAALLVFAATTLTESIVFGGSFVTLTWLLLLGCCSVRECEVPAAPQEDPAG
jgi:hypothetical protein